VIKLQNFILGISGVLLATMLLLFSLQTTINLEAAFKEINNRHIQNVSEIISTELTLKKTEISNILKLLESNNDLASSYLLSSETKDYSLFQSKLQAIKEKANLDFIDVISKNGKPFFNAFNVLDLLTDSFSSADYGIINGRPVLIMASPLKYFNETVGYVVA
jgi:C4-dicarboxylate-specific signal transduction histidine kinase